MRNTIGILLGLGATVASVLAFPTTTWAQRCRAASIPPSPEFQEFQSADLGLSLSIPSNYRSVLRSSGHITFHDPGSFELIQCLVRTGQYGALPPYATLEIHKGVSADADLLLAVRQKRPWVDYYNPDYVPVEVAGYSAIQYEYINEIYQTPISNISFLSQDGRTLITLSGPTQHPILQNALSTLTLSPASP